MAKVKTRKEAPISPQERVKRYLVQRFYTRFHMSLILMGAGLAAMVSNWALLHMGVGKMWLRYPVAVTMSYLTFLAGVWLWIQYVEYRRGNASANQQTAESDASRTRKAKSGGGGDLLDIPLNSGGGSSGGSSVELPNVLRGGGGSFDGGAAGSWDDVVPVQSLVGNSGGGVSAPSMPTPSGGGSSMFSGLGDIGDLDGDAVILIVLALLLIGSILIVSGYIVWFAPDILSEAIFGATLAGGLAGTARRQDNEGWVMGVVKKTWWPFAIVFVAAMSCAIYAQIHYPAARTLGEALRSAIAG